METKRVITDEQLQEWYRNFLSVQWEKLCDKSDFCTLGREFAKLRTAFPFLPRHPDQEHRLYGKTFIEQGSVKQPYASIFLCLCHYENEIKSTGRLSAESREDFKHFVKVYCEELAPLIYKH